MEKNKEEAPNAQEPLPALEIAAPRNLLFSGTRDVSVLSNALETPSDLLGTIRISIRKMLENPFSNNCSLEFVQGYNAVYKYCTSDTSDKYVIEGGRIYSAYDAMLLQYLGKFPEDFSLKSLVKFLMGYREANQRITRMLSFLSRYFVRINLEIGNTNVKDLTQLYFSRVLDVLLVPREDLVHRIFLSEIQVFIRDARAGAGSRRASASASSLLRHKQKVIRAFLRECVGISKFSGNSRFLKKMMVKWAAQTALALERESSAGSGNTSDPRPFSHLTRLSLALPPALFRSGETTQVALYRMIEERLSENFLRALIQGFLAGSRVFTRPASSSAGPDGIMHFLDCTRRARKMFVSSFLLSAFSAVSEITSVSGLLRLLISLNRSLSRMPRIHSRTRNPLEMLFSRRADVLRRSLEEKDETSRARTAFSDSLLLEVEKHIGRTPSVISELALFASRMPPSDTFFWQRFFSGVKKRLILGEDPGSEKKLVSLVLKKQNGIRDLLKKEVAEGVPEPVSQYISKHTPPPSSRNDPSGFEEVLLCIRDVAVSEIFFKREAQGVSVDCKLLSYTRWAFPTCPRIRVPHELESIWADVHEHCRKKGRKYTLSLCPTVSSIILQVHRATITCSLVQGAAVIAVGKAGSRTLEELVRMLEAKDDHASSGSISASFPLPSFSLFQVLPSFLEPLLDAQVLLAAGMPAVYSLNSRWLEEENRHIDLFVPDPEQPEEKEQTREKKKKTSTIEAFLVQTAKQSVVVKTSALIAAAEETLAVTRDEVLLSLSSLHDRGLLAVGDEDGDVKYVP